MIARKMFKDTRTTVELGYELFPSSERGIAGLKKLPDEINQKLQKAISDFFKDRAYLEAAKNDKPVLSFLAGNKWASRVEQVKQSLEPFVPLVSKEK